MAGVGWNDQRAQRRGHSRENIRYKFGKVISDRVPWEASKSRSIYQSQEMHAGEGNTSIAEKLGGVVFCRSGMMEGEALMLHTPG